MKNLLIVIGVCIISIQLWALSLQWYVDWVMETNVTVDKIIVIPKDQ